MAASWVYYFTLGGMTRAPCDSSSDFLVDRESFDPPRLPASEILTSYLASDGLLVRGVENFDLPRFTAEDSFIEAYLSSFGVFLEAYRRLLRSFFESSWRIMVRLFAAMPVSLPKHGSCVLLEVISQISQIYSQFIRVLRYLLIYKSILTERMRQILETLRILFVWQQHSISLEYGLRKELCKSILKTGARTEPTTVPGSRKKDIFAVG